MDALHYEQAWQAKAALTTLIVWRRCDETDGNCREAGAIILKIGYGYTIEPHDADPLVDLGDRAIVQFTAASAPGAWMVDSIPACQFSRSLQADVLIC